MFISMIVILVSLMIAYIMIPPLLKKGEKKTIFAFSILLFIGAILNIAIGLKINIPSPLDFITFIFTPIRKMLLSFF
ncbi:hypothetical protein FCT18_05410 [Lysinibacillus sphaericus]|uniref:Uncharacterized protein n=3 Tax=Lysinibacillus TaxID=400634 RepID=A0A2S0K120_LYSSH|nr:MULTISPECIES: hypothetical protein [Lysinibacillus]AHN21801.1 hypothetical protein T479_10575 [Lysinibacillus varians]AVK97031.1 hypothetical protein LS41612_12530 [Lysinibacillus sphaericus]MCS1384692.1 hypothetical protein [Lysinibacillus sphaericus]MED4542310.1 hypothetical protein [Lysinibacillus sphaericus]TKI20307.1 hypothetical protein FCT18_05410 [Lysinibacillus sphaericus]